ncbi:tumor necrosis factor receptor superfamily member 6-like isoform X2 [Conger conger]|uniref:tumor necrosis factor receptor superfamily member 6-like isoform X2 n=1 Tax=Conger conger TaxID=82655 RepID=UPI002A5A66AA|nr:tumor necrosis factor receptor superfamily member 6-like isoform X2 [Conger conger]
MIFSPRELILILISLEAQFTTITEGGHPVKRQQCEYGDGNYLGSQCCKCPAGFHVLACNQSVEPKCDECERGSSYLDHHNLLDSCEPCKICDPKVNQETETHCTVIKNTVCRCTKGFYCDKEECRACHSCKTCEDGFVIEKECTRTNNTVCKVVDNGWLWWIIVIPILLLIGVPLFLKKQKYLCFGPPNARPVSDEERAVELIPLKGIDLGPHRSSIIDILGPKRMRELVRSELTDAQIQFCQEEAPNDVREQSYKMLHKWCELQGLENAAPNLIKKLNEIGQKTTADKIKKKILDEKK